MRIPHNVLDLFQAEESQKKRRTQEGNDKGGPLLHSTQNSVLKMCQLHSLLYLCLFSALRPPVPPDFCPAFSSIVRLLCCDIFIHVLRRVLQRVAEEQTTRWTEAMIQRVGITSLDAVNFTWLLVFITQTTCCNN